MLGSFVAQVYGIRYGGWRPRDRVVDWNQRERVAVEGDITFCATVYRIPRQCRQCLSIYRGCRLVDAAVHCQTIGRRGSLAFLFASPCLPTPRRVSMANVASCVARVWHCKGSEEDISEDWKREAQVMVTVGKSSVGVRCDNRPMKTSLGEVAVTFTFTINMKHRQRESTSNDRLIWALNRRVDNICM